MELSVIQSKIYEVRGQKVMLDSDLAMLYETETKKLKQAVKRNIERFPEDFMFELSKEEYNSLRSQNPNLRSQIVTSSWGGDRYLPYVFTEQGVAMLSSVLKSGKAIQVNISIVRAFVLLKQFALSHKELTTKLNELENKYNKQFKDVYEVINYLIDKEKQDKEDRERKRIGFKQQNTN